MSEQEILQTISQMITGDYSLKESAIDLVSSTILTTEIVDRICWIDGHWDPRGVNAIMRRFSSGEMPNTHPQVLAVTLKSLCEAIEGMGANLLRSQSRVKTTPIATKALLDVKEKELSGVENKVSLSKLRPGMKTSQPITALNGKMIIEKDTPLDEDLIWRLWQLAAVRPINPITIFSKTF
jgi:hypothetical protein